MRWPEARFTIRRGMIAVAILALVLGLATQHRDAVVAASFFLLVVAYGVCLLAPLLGFLALIGFFLAWSTRDPGGGPPAEPDASPPAGDLE